MPASAVSLFIFLGWAILAVLPVLAYLFFDFRKWRRHYGSDHTFSGYMFKMYSGKMAAEDHWPVKILKVLFCLFWVGFITSNAV